MKPHEVTEAIVQDKLEDKILAWVEQVSTFRSENNMLQKDLYDALGMDKGQFSRLMRSPNNVTLETIVKFDIALGRETFVTPDDYEESLVDDPERLTQVLDAAVKENPNFFYKAFSGFIARTMAAEWESHASTLPHFGSASFAIHSGEGINGFIDIPGQFPQPNYINYYSNRIIQAQNPNVLLSNSKTPNEED